MPGQQILHIQQQLFGLVLLYHTCLQWFWLHIREEPVFLASNVFQFQFQKMPCSFMEFVKRCDVFETFLLHL